MECIIWAQGLLADPYTTSKIGAGGLIVIAAIVLFKLGRHFKPPKKRRPRY